MDSSRGSYLLGFDNADLSDVAFQNVKLYFHRENPEDDRFPCNYSDVRDKKAAFYLKKAKNVRFENVRFVCEEGLFDHELLCEETENVALVDSDVAVSHVKKKVVET